MEAGATGLEHNEFHSSATQQGREAEWPRPPFGAWSSETGWRRSRDWAFTSACRTGVEDRLVQAQPEVRRRTLQLEKEPGD